MRLDVVKTREMPRLISPADQVFSSTDEKRRAAFTALRSSVKCGEHADLKQFATTVGKFNQAMDAVCDTMLQHGGDGDRLGDAVGVLLEGGDRRDRVGDVLITAAASGNERAVRAALRQDPSSEALWHGLHAAAIGEHVGVAVLIAHGLGRGTAGQCLLDTMHEQGVEGNETAKAAGTLRLAGLIK